MRVLSDITDYSVRAGTTSIDNLAFRKCKKLSSVILTEGLLSIGDAAFSFCSSLRQIQIPASVEHIGVAAFCKSGLITIQFRGIPKVIEADIFEGCGQLKEIVVPNGSRDMFVREFDLPEEKVVEGREQTQVVKQPTELNPAPHSDSPFEMKPVRGMRFSYNARFFNWAVGDNVNLSNVFSGPITLAGNITYEFRRKALFIFMKSTIARTMKPAVEYELPACVASFKHKYQEKYAYRAPRIFIFVSDDGRLARYFDEVQLIRMDTDTIMVKSMLKSW